MARVQIKRAVQNTVGDAQVGLSVTITIAGTANQAVIYQDETTGTTIAQPLVTDASGYIPGWIDEGAYDMSVGAPISTTLRLNAVDAARSIGYPVVLAQQVFS